MSVEFSEAVPYVLWRQRDKTFIRIVNMDDKHLFNTIRMLERKADKRLAEAEESQCDDSEEHFDYSREQFVSSVYHSMVALAKARGILI